MCDYFIKKIKAKKEQLPSSVWVYLNYLLLYLFKERSMKIGNTLSK